MLYFGEGAKTQKTVDLANSDPRILKIFMLYLRRIFSVDEKRIRLYLYCFSDQNVEELKNFWSACLAVHIEQFIKPYIRDCSHKKKRVMPWGVLHIRYNEKRLLEKILSLCSTLTAQIVEKSGSGRYSSGQRGQTVKRQPLEEILK